jgi:hypothetical protein
MPLLPWDIFFMVVDLADDASVKNLYRTSSDLRRRSAKYVWKTLMVYDGSKPQHGAHSSLHMLSQPRVIPYVRNLVVNLKSVESTTQDILLPTFLAPLGGLIAQTAVTSITFSFPLLQMMETSEMIATARACFQ